jgi:hypothetical protein
MQPDLFRVFVDTGDEAPVEFSKVVNVIDMPYAPVTDQQISGLGTTLAKSEGDSFGFDEPIIGGQKAYTPAAYGLAIEFTWEGWRDELYGVFQEMVRELRRASDNRLEVDAWSVYNNAFSTSFVGFTSGESLCSTSHTGLDGTSRANRPTVDTDFSFAAVQAAMVSYHNLTDERNLPRLMSPAMALVGPSFYHDAREILGSTGKPLSADNEINSLVPDDIGFMVSHYFTDADQWFINARTGVHDVNFFVRDRPMFEMFDDPRTKNAVATVYQRHVGGYGTWRGVYGSNGG